MTQGRAAPRIEERPDLNLVVREQLPRLYRVAFRLSRTPSEAEDLVAQTLLLAAKGWEGFDGRFPAAWLLRILNNAFLQRMRSETGVDLVPLESVAEATAMNDLSKELETRWTQELILASMSKLPPEQRVAITLCDIEQLPYETVAAALDIPVGTVCSRLYRARKSLQRACLNATQGNL